MKTILPTAVLLATAFAVRAEIRTQTVEYKDGEVVLEGTATWDTAIAGKRPGVLIVHQWKGITD